MHRRLKILREKDTIKKSVWLWFIIELSTEKQLVTKWKYLLGRKFIGVRYTTTGTLAPRKFKFQNDNLQEKF